MAAQAVAQPPAMVAALPACKAGALSVGLDGENGAFAGMSHDGALLVLRNVGPGACRVPGLPTLRFEDAADKVLPIARRAPPGMHPGPVVLPVGLAEGAEATAGLLWVDGPVFGETGGRCFKPARLVVVFGEVAAEAPLAATICGPDGSPATFDQKLLTVDPASAP